MEEDDDDDDDDDDDLFLISHYPTKDSFSPILSFSLSLSIYPCVCLLSFDELPFYPNLVRSTRFILARFYIICLKRADGLVFLLRFSVNIPKYSLKSRQRPLPPKFFRIYNPLLGFQLYVIKYSAEVLKVETKSQ